VVRQIFDLAVVIAVAMDIPLLQVPSFGEGGIETEEELMQTARMLAYGCRRAQSHGILVGTENALSAQDNLRLLEACGCDNLKVYFDTQNPWAMKGYNSAEILETLFPHVCEVHIKDGRGGTLGNALLGQGDSSFEASLEILLERTFGGWMILENGYHQPELAAIDANPSNLIARDIGYLRECLQRKMLDVTSMKQDECLMERK
jgi:sugar phosphate isomerase/epimerase